MDYVNKYDLMRAEGIDVDEVRLINDLYGKDIKIAVKGIKSHYKLSKKSKKS